jgi:hypothetical protein
VQVPHFHSITQQVAAYLRQELLCGRWVGEMPGQNQLKELLGISGKTVEMALRMLEEEGLLGGQGAGRRRRIELPEEKIETRTLRVAVLSFEPLNRVDFFMTELRLRLDDAGHFTFAADKTLQELGMDVGRVARMVRRTAADAWVVFAASREILEWFLEQEIPTFALAGRRSGLLIAGTGPDKPPVYGEVTRYLIAQGHRRISFFCRRQLRFPHPGLSLRAYLSELEAAGITTGAFNLPDWEESCEGFSRALDSLFATTPPTALILDEPFLFHAAYHYVSGRRLHVPQDVSLVCTDPDPGFAWCRPSVAHIRWDYQPVVRRVIRWVNNVARGKDDRTRSHTMAEFVNGGTIGPVKVDKLSRSPS